MLRSRGVVESCDRLPMQRDEAEGESGSSYSSLTYSVATSAPSAHVNAFPYPLI